MSGLSAALVAALGCALGCGSRGEHRPAVGEPPRPAVPGDPEAPPPEEPRPITAADAPPPRLPCAAPTRPAPLELDGSLGWACVDLEGKRNGRFLTLYPDGATELSGHYADDLLDGSWRRLSHGGKVAESGSYVAGKKDGLWQIYNDTGGLLGDYQMTAGTGVERRWYADGQLASERSFKDGLADGPSQVFVSGGGVLYSAQFRAGKLDGPRHVGLPGAMRLDDRWVEGVPRGHRQILRRSHVAFDVTFDEEGLPVGRFAAWRNRTTLRERGTYVRGDKHGVWRWYDRGRSLEREGSYFLGLRHGRWREWDGGRLVMEGTYVKGKPSGKFTWWTSSGSVAGRFKMKKGTGTMLTFHDDGERASELTMVRGVRHGLYRELSPQGRVLVEGLYKDDAKHGPWIERNRDGELVRETTYVDGKIDGLLTRYRRGQIVAEQTYVAGLRQGPYRELAPRPGSGELIERVTGAYDRDRKSGEWIHRDAQGEPALVKHYQDGVLHGGFEERAQGEVVVRGQHTRGRRSGVWSWAAPKGGAVRTITYDPP